MGGNGRIMDIDRGSRPLRSDEILVTFRGEFLEPSDMTNIAFTDNVPDTSCSTLSSYFPAFLSNAWFWMLAILASFAALMGTVASPDNFAGALAMVLGIGVLVMVPFTIGPVLESVLGGPIGRVLKWGLIVLAIGAFLFPFVRDILDGKLGPFLGGYAGG